jgi:hypothetical protein
MSLLRKVTIACGLGGWSWLQSLQGLEEWLVKRGRG